MDKQLEQFEANAKSPTMQAEVTCPLCEYNLRGLSEPRCPECGYAFTWDEIFDEKRRLHRYLFEHHPQRNLWSFGMTVIGGLSPMRFWRTLHPSQPSRRNRMLLYLMIVLGLSAIPLAIDASFRSARWPGMFNYTHRIQLGWHYASRFPMNLLERLLRASTRQLLVAGFVTSLGLPLLNYALLMIFQQTMRKAQVRAHHVQRCVVYSADVLLVPALLLSAMAVINVLPNSREMWSEEMAWTILLSYPLIWLLMALRLILAYRHYLRFDHAVATILSVQFIIFLLLALILYNLV